MNLPEKKRLAWKDGILTMLKLSKLASHLGEKEVALSLLVTSLAAESAME